MVSAETDIDGAQQPGAVRREVITAGPAEALAALFDIDAPPVHDGDALPPLWHWVYLNERSRQGDLGPDGHPTLGIPSPPGPGYIRMFAGGRVDLHTPLRFGEVATRRIRVANRVEKAGRSGPLIFVTTRAEISQQGRLAIVEEQDIVYRRQPASGGPASPGSASPGPAVPPAVTNPAVTAALALLEFEVDPVVLFRFSALTYNAHRIHYDRTYAQCEGHPDLVVHGPLQAMLMGEAFRRSGLTLWGREFSYRLIAPTFGTQRLSVIAGDDADTGLRVRDARGLVTATSDVRAVPLER